MLLEKKLILQKKKPQQDINFWEILSKIKGPDMELSLFLREYRHYKKCQFA